MSSGVSTGMSTGVSTETVPAPVPSLPRWPEAPGEVDPAAGSYLVVAVGHHARTREVARAWVAAAEPIAPTLLAVLDGVDEPADRAALDDALARTRTGVRILAVGGQYDVLRVLTLARDAGAIDAELTAFVVDDRDLPMYCAHCRAAHRVTGAPGDVVTCPGCARSLEIHAHHAAALGSFLASEAS